MAEETRTPEQIQRSLHGTRRRIEDDLEELRRRMHSRADSVPGWVKGASIAAALYLMRRPLFRLVRAVATLSAPIVVPLVIGKIMERRQSWGERDAFRETDGYGETGPLGERRSYGEEAFGEGRAFRDASYVP
ncbi:MAG: hypothetical protein ACRD21_05695 [Vicinamibacteria bacterium]